ncbi:putative 2-phosphosulfolactate phosphatase [Planctomycetales bacterium]|nr:putative 2-phosphosulfolactate phosphatase [Planctomycetales bacterium]
MPSITVYSLPSLLKTGLSGSCAVVIDVLRATTVIACAASAGIKNFIPVTDIDEAKRIKKQFPPDSVILGGERQGLPIDGFDLGNSPQHYTPQQVAGKTLIITTTNGTVAMHAATSADKIVLAAFVNARSVVEVLKNEERIAIICSGTYGKETTEDLLLAGTLVSRLTALRNYDLDETAKKVRELWNDHFTVPEITELLRQSTGGQNLIRLGLDEDITAAAQLDSVKAVPVIVLPAKERDGLYNEISQ